MIDSGKASVDILATHLDNKRTVPVPIPNCKDVKTVLFCHNLSLASIFFRSHSSHFTKNSTEIMLAIKTRSFRNLRDAPMWVFR